MKKLREEIFNLMEMLGGKHFKEDGDDCWSFLRPPLEITFADPRIIELPTSVSVCLSVWVYENTFTKLLEKIFGTEPYPFKVSEIELSLAYDADCTDELRIAVNEKLAMACDLSIREEMELLASERPDRGLMLQKKHLAALAWKGDFITLGEYQAVFERGKHLNFLPMITKDMINRALELSYDHVT